MNAKLFKPVNKKPKLKNGVMRLRCNLQDKARWVRQSRREGLTLSQWVINTLEKELK